MESSMKTNIVNSARTYAAIRAHRTMLARTLDGMVNPIARKGIEEAIARYDAELAAAPIAVKATTEKKPVDRKAAAYRAWRTMLTGDLKGTRGKVRAEIKAKIAHYDALLAA
jgi:hypothetical protein